MKKIKVLYIDDEEINLEVFYSTFRKKYDVYTANSANEGMKLLDNNSISIIISDQKMPHKTGVEFFEEVKVKYPDTVRIILTAYADYETAYDSINKGFVFRFVQKPWDFEDISNTIEDSYKIYTLTRKNKALLSQYQLLFDHHTIPVFIVQSDNHEILKANECAMEFFSLVDFNIDINMLLPFAEVVQNPNHIINVVNGKKENRKVSVKFEEINWEGKVCFLVSLEDQTEIIDFEKKKVEFISEMEDKERKRLSMELHDGCAQDLVLLKLYFESFSDSNKDLHEEFMSVYQKITNGIRSMSYNLNPPDLEEGISAAIQKLFERMDKVSDTKFIFENNSFISLNEFVDDNKAYHLYRIIQEFINNSTKYSHATEIKVKFDVVDNKFELKIQDNGKGFDKNLVGTGSGLQNMNDRCRVSSMKFELKTRLNEGTQVKITIQE
jgi:signal transduction histidine kinase